MSAAGWREFPASQEEYENMLSYVMEQAEEAGVPLKRQLKLQLGFEEASVNVISYAYESEEGRLWLRAYAEGEDFVLELKDSGTPFNPLAKEDALARKPQSLEETKIGGLGIAFMRRIFSEITYHYGEEEGLFCNHLTLRFKMAEQAAGHGEHF